MAEPLAVDPTGLSAAAAKLAGLVFPQPPAPIAVSGTDSVVAAINETMPSIESLVSDGLPGVKAALTRTASNMNAAADVYAKTDQSLGTSLSQYAFGSSGEGLAGVRLGRWSAKSGYPAAEHTRVTGHDPARRDGR